MRTGKTRSKINPRFVVSIFGPTFYIASVLYFLLASMYPIIMSYVYSFYEWDGLGPLVNFVGFANYAGASRRHVLEQL